MDPATILGTTLGILSFVKCMGKIVLTAVKVHKSRNGTIRENKKFTDVIADFHIRLKNIHNGAGIYLSTASAESTGDGDVINDFKRQLLSTIEKCEELATEIESVLGKTQAANKDGLKLGARWLRKLPHSTSASDLRETTLFEAIRAAGRTAWKKDLVEKSIRTGKVALYNLTRSFPGTWHEVDGSHVTQKQAETDDRTRVLFRFETISQLEELGGMLQHHSADLADIHRLVQELVRDLHNVTNLATFFQGIEQSDSLLSLERRNREKILDAIQFHGIHARRDQVLAPAGDTLSWLIKEESVLESPSPALNVSLRLWPRTGSGVFHITGKRGSGKSTLMKGIDQSKEAETQVRERAIQD
jgi:hypothetical protein